tara:strand:- start:360 stop:758 length:399 start_codon:yes stop_codon:yes gene_type:complete
MRLEKVIFAIGNNSDLHTVAKFTRLMDTARAMGDLQGSVVSCIGHWTNNDGSADLEPSYMMDKVDYDKFVVPSGYVDGQVCVLLIPGDTRQPCSLSFSNGDRHALKPMRRIQSTVGVTDWTYVIATGEYFTC